MNAPPKNDPRTLFGWYIYDWANSAYSTTVAAVLLPIYFADVVVGREGVVIGGTLFKASTLWGFTVGLATFIAFVSSPILGAIADFSAAKKKFLLTFAYTGSFFATLLFFCAAGDVFLTLLLFLITQVGFIGSLVFYDAFLPQIASEDKLDWVSSKGFSYGYIGGGLQFAMALGLVYFHEALGIPQSLAVRLAMIMAGLWWAGFALITAARLKETPSKETMPSEFAKLPRVFAFARLGFSRTLRTVKKVGRFRQLVLFLVAFMFYDDGIQTVIAMASIYGLQELNLKPTTVMLTFLVVQGVATLGALFFGRLARRLGTKPTVMVTLVVWLGIIVYAYFIHTATEFFVLGAAVGIAMGGSQALSRSLYGSIVPEEASAEFYGFYTVFSKFSAIWGPWIFATVEQATGSSRLAILSLVAQFIVGIVLLSRVDIEKAREAKLAGAF